MNLSDIYNQMLTAEQEVSTWEQEKSAMEKVAEDCFAVGRIMARSEFNKQASEGEYYQEEGEQLSEADYLELRKQEIMQELVNGQ